MKSVAFKSTLTPDGQLVLPAEIAGQVDPGMPVQVVLLWDSTEDDDWRAAGLRHLAEAYAPEDEIYEQLANAPPTQ